MTAAPRPVVSNSSPLIALTRIRQIDLLPRLFGTILIPPAVAAEVWREAPPPPWCNCVPIHTAVASLGLSPTLGPGESEAIALALEHDATWTLLDDRAARRDASRRGLQVIGTLGLLAAAKRRGEIAAIKPLLDALSAANFRIAPSLYRQILQDAGEAP